jgi:RNA polymerase sigma-70 factor (ECF subfamily)
MPDQPTAYLQECLDRLRAGDESARRELVELACARLVPLARQMCREYPDVHRWEQTDDVLQNALLRLWQALAEVRPSGVRDFLRLAAVQIRRALIDLGRHYSGPQGLNAHHASQAGGDRSDGSPLPAFEPSDNTHEPSRLAVWTEFHHQVEALPEPEKEIVDLLWYQGLAQAEAAALLQVDVRTVKRRWQAARLKLDRALGEG